VLTGRLGAGGQVNLWMLQCEDLPIAFELHLVHRGVTAALRASFDESFARLSPGAYLERQIIRRLFEQPDGGVIEYNTCAGDYAYTRRWTDRVRSYRRAWCFRRDWLGAALTLLGRLRRPRVPQMRKSVRPDRRDQRSAAGGDERGPTMRGNKT
jgi:CelD/BcsL family acetyltransferase involved in cellulose biosynthesis